MNRVQAYRSVNIRAVSRRYFEGIGKRIAELRRSHGFTQAELARRIGVSQQAMFAYETGERRVSMLIVEMLATVFSMSIDQLCGRSPVAKVGKRRLSPRAMRNAERIQGLSKTSQRFLIKILDHLEALQNRKG